MWGTNNGIFSINNSNGTTATTTKSGDAGFDPQTLPQLLEVIMLMLQQISLMFK